MPKFQVLSRWFSYFTKLRYNSGHFSSIYFRFNSGHQKILGFENYFFTITSKLNKSVKIKAINKLKLWMTSKSIAIVIKNNIFCIISMIDKIEEDLESHVRRLGGFNQWKTCAVKFYWLQNQVLRLRFFYRRYPELEDVRTWTIVRVHLSNFGRFFSIFVLSRLRMSTELFFFNQKMTHMK